MVYDKILNDRYANNEIKIDICNKDVIVDTGF